jgi:hypothetical protein
MKTIRITVLLPLLAGCAWAAQLTPASPLSVSWQFKEWISLVGAIMTASAPIITVMWYIGNKHLGGTMKIAIQEANAKQTQDQLEMLKELRQEFIPAMKTDLSGAEIKRIFEDIQRKVSEVHTEMRDIDASRLRHEANTLKLIQLLATEVSVVKATGKDSAV